MNILCEYCGKRTGIFCIQLGETYFPSRDWDDFCVPIVSDWIDTVNRSCPGSAFRLYFMDGRPCGHNPGQGTVRSVLICVCILLGSSREETA